MSNRKVKKKSQFSMVMKRLAKNKMAIVGMVIVILLTLIAIFAKVLMPYDYSYQDPTAILKSPSAAHLLGTDNLGRDILSRLIYGTRLSLILGVVSVLLAALLGGILGSIAGYYGGVVDDVLMRFLDIYQSIPGLVMCVAMAAALGRGIDKSILAIGITTMAGYARMMRSSIMTIKGSEYIEAAKAVKGSDFHVIMKHLIPNSLSPMIVQMTMGIGGAILLGSMLSFVGLGVPAPTPEWGTMLADGRSYMRDYGYMVIYPGIAVIITVLAFNLLGDGLRDALDPKLKN
jgi:peptide/nickel transport system permease protein